MSSARHRATLGSASSGWSRANPHRAPAAGARSKPATRRQRTPISSRGEAPVQLFDRTARTPRRVPASRWWRALVGGRLRPQTRTRLARPVLRRDGVNCNDMPALRRAPAACSGLRAEASDDDEQRYAAGDRRSWCRLTLTVSTRASGRCALGRLGHHPTTRRDRPFGKCDDPAQGAGDAGARHDGGTDRMENELSQPQADVGPRSTGAVMPPGRRYR